jgi:hypothetical protein
MLSQCYNRKCQGGICARRLLAICLLFLVAGAIALLVSQWLLVWNRTSRDYRFELSGSPPFLTEPIALTNAQRTLSADGYNVAQWAAEASEDTKAPDGTPDVYLLRDSTNPKRGTIRFHRVDAWASGRIVQRLVIIELKDGAVSCRITHVD